MTKRANELMSACDNMHPLIGGFMVLDGAENLLNYLAKKIYVVKEIMYRIIIEAQV